MLPGTVLEPVSECFLASLIIGWAAHYVFRYLTNLRADTGSCSSHQMCNFDGCCSQTDQLSAELRPHTRKKYELLFKPVWVLLTISDDKTPS